MRSINILEYLLRTKTSLEFFHGTLNQYLVVKHRKCVDEFLWRVWVCFLLEVSSALLNDPLIKKHVTNVVTFRGSVAEDVQFIVKSCRRLRIPSAIQR